jgi:tetratricopeptide (TPR) repeat protein
MKSLRALLRHALGLAVLTSAALAAATETPPSAQLSDQTGEELGKVKALADAQNVDGAIKLIDTRLAAVDAESFDAAVLLQIGAQLRLQKGAPGESIKPLARSIELADKHGYFEPVARTQMAFLLAQLEFQDSMAARDAETGAARQAEAIKLMERWSAEVAKPGFDGVFFHASLLYTAGAGAKPKPDEALLRRALAQVDKAFLLTVRPPDNLYQLKVACLQQLGRAAEAAETLEQLVELKPTDGAHWAQLVGAYMGAAAASKDAKDVTTYNVRAILAIERAQKQGFMTTPKDRFNLVGIHFNIQQFDRAITLLSEGLRDGTIDNERKNWELLAYSYQQAERDADALQTLLEAAKRFPDAAQLEYQIALIEQSLDHPAEAITHLRRCIEKGGGDTPHSVYLFLSYLALEQKSFDEARLAAASAMNYPEGLKEGERLKKAAEDMLAARKLPENPRRNSL